MPNGSCNEIKSGFQVKRNNYNDMGPQKRHNSTKTKSRRLKFKKRK